MFSTELMQSAIQNAYWIVLTPFLVGFAIILGLRQSKTLSMILSVGSVLYGLAHSLLIFYALNQPSMQGNFHAVTHDWTYFSCFDLRLTIGCLIDNLAAVMLIVVTSVSLLVQIYTHGYMREDPGYSRFYAYLSLFTGSMLGLVVATNLFQMYFFWELVGVCSYFLIGFWWYKNSAAEACLKAFVVNRIGDCGFLVGIIMLLAATWSYWSGGAALSFTGLPGHDLGSAIKSAYTAHAVAYWGFTGLFGISMCILAGPVAKSAQFPLHVWLPDAMEGPTPISALIHAATMVAAGVYLVARAYPIWEFAPEGLTGWMGAHPGLFVVTCIGAFTAFMAATIAMSQFDIKRILAWSTCSQLGYMFVGLGAGAFTGGFFHLFNHAFFKAMLFLCSGVVIHGLHGEQDVRKMGGLRKYMPGTAYCCLIGCLAISGCPGLSGFFSKDEIIAASWHAYPFIGILMMFTAGLTAFYMFRMYFLTFEGEYRGEAHPHNSSPAMVWPLIALAVPSICSGWLGFNMATLSDLPSMLSKMAPGPAHASHFGSFVYFGKPEFEGMDPGPMLVSLILAAAGFAVAYFIYVTKSLNTNTQIVESKNPIVATIYDYSFNKWHWDTRYMAICQGVLWLFQKMWNTVDQLIVDNLVNFTSLFTMSMGQLLKYTQNGQGQYYALVIFGWVAVLTLAAYLLRP